MPVIDPHTIVMGVSGIVFDQRKIGSVGNIRHDAIGFLYKLTFASGKSYFGITTKKSVSNRVSDHRSATLSGCNFAVNRAWRKHGEPLVSVLAIAKGDFLLELESRAIAAYGTYGKNGYNMTPGGDIGPTTLPEIRVKLSIAKIGTKLSPETIAKLRGRIFSDQHRAKIRLARAKQVITEETKAKLRAAVMSEETRKKISDALKGRRQSASHLANRIAAMRTPEARAKFSAASKGRPKSPETKAKMSIAGKKRYAKFSI